MRPIRPGVRHRKEWVNVEQEGSPVTDNQGRSHTESYREKASRTHVTLEHRLLEESATYPLMPTLTCKERQDVELTSGATDDDESNGVVTHHGLWRCVLSDGDVLRRCWGMEERLAGVEGRIYG